MAPYARQPLGGWRNEACNIAFTVANLDTSAMVVRAQIRQSADNPVLTLDLEPTTDPNATGIRLVSVTHDANGVPSSNYMWQVAKASMQALPYAGELGEPWVGQFAIQIAGITRVVGSFAALASPIDSDGAPANRVPSYGGSASFVTPGSGFLLTIGTDSVTLSIFAADLMAGLLAQAQAAEKLAAAHLAAFPAYYVGANGGLTPTINFGAIQNQIIPATVTRFLLNDGGQVIEDITPAVPAAGTSYGQAAMQAYPHCVSKTADNRFFRRSAAEGIDFGQIGDATGGAYSDAAFQEAQAYLKEIARRNSRTFAYETTGINVPAYGRFRFASPIEITCAMLLQGFGHANPFGLLSQLIFDPGVGGIIVQRDTTYGYNNVGPSRGSGQRTIIRGVDILARDANGNPSIVVGGNSLVTFRAAGEIDLCVIDGASNNGFDVIANVGGGQNNHEGEASESRVTRCVIGNNRNNGGFWGGSDVNIGFTERNRFIQNGGYAQINQDAGPFHSGSNHYVGNGKKGAGYGQAEAAAVFDNGHYFALKFNADPTQANQPANRPNADGSDNAFWSNMGAVPTTLGYGIDQWTAGMALRNGGIFWLRATGSISLNDYAEGMQPNGWCNATIDAASGRKVGGIIGSRSESTKMIEYSL